MASLPVSEYVTVRIIARALSQCPHTDTEPCQCLPGTIALHDARKVLAGLHAAGVELTVPSQALDVEVEQ